MDSLNYPPKSGWELRAERIEALLEAARNAVNQPVLGGPEYQLLNVRDALYPTPESGHVTPEGGQ